MSIYHLLQFYLNFYDRKIFLIKSIIGIWLETYKHDETFNVKKQQMYDLLNMNWLKNDGYKQITNIKNHFNFK